MAEAGRDKRCEEMTHGQYSREAGGTSGDTHLDTQSAMSHGVDRGNSGRAGVEIAQKRQSDREGQAGEEIEQDRL